MDKEQIKERVDLIRDSLIQYVPFIKAIGMEVVDADIGKTWTRVPYADHLVGNPDTGVIHGGVISAVLDNASGVAVRLALEEDQSIATLDLRIDYMKPATPHVDLNAFAHCYKVTKNIAFVRSTAYHDDIDDPIATSVGAFMLAANRAAPPSAEAMQALMSAA